MANLWDPVVVYDSAMASYWSEQTYLSDTQLVPLAASAVTGSRMEVHFARTVPTGLREDLAMYAICYAVEAGPGAPMSRLDTADAARVETSFAAKWNANVGFPVATDWTIKEFAWRHVGADFPLDKNGISKPGTYWRIQPSGVPGGASFARLPDQVAITVTYRTASRAHWGRTYTGGYTTNACNDSLMGHITTATVDSLALTFRDHFDDVYDDARKTWPFVWSAKYRGALSVNELSVDDTFDIIRSRRAKFPSYRKTYTS